MEEVSNVCAWIDEDGKVLSEERVRMTEEHFVGIINEMKEEIMNKKKLYEEIMSRVIRRSTNLSNIEIEHEKPFIKWHYDRYLLFNRIKGDLTTVGDIVSY